MQPLSKWRREDNQITRLMATPKSKLAKSCSRCSFLNKSLSIITCNKAAPCMTGIKKCLDYSAGFILIMRHLWCVVLPLIMITKCTDGKHKNYDLIIIILWNNHYNLNFNVGQQEMKMTIIKSRWYRESGCATTIIAAATAQIVSKSQTMLLNLQMQC